MAKNEYRPTWSKFNSNTFTFDFADWTTQAIHKRVAEIVPLAKNTSFGRFAYMKLELAALRNESVKRQNWWQARGFKGNTYTSN